MQKTFKAPFPYFGGKRAVADEIWKVFSPKIKNYVEPFGGSMAVLLNRPEYSANTVETVNELNPFIVNAFIAIKNDPEKVAYYTDNPTYEVILHQKHLWLVKEVAPDLKQEMMKNNGYYDCEVAGWWLWGICNWLGSGWCEIDKEKPAQSMPYLKSQGIGAVSVSKQVPRLSAKQGVFSQQIPEMTSNRGINSLDVRSNLVEYFEGLANRLKSVRIICGSWDRVMGYSVTYGIGDTAIFLDPPYETGSDLYNGETNQAYKEVIAWCKAIDERTGLANWYNPKLRIALCGYEGEYDVPSEWRVLEWKAPKGYQTTENDGRHKERVWLSPACLELTKTKQNSLF